MWSALQTGHCLGVFTDAVCVQQDDPASLPRCPDHRAAFYRWRKEYGGLKLDQAKRLKDLEKENSKLKRLVAELSLERQILKDVAEGNF